MSDPSKLFEIQELSDIFDQDTNSNKAAEVASRIRSMIWDQHIDSLFPLDEYTLQEIEKLAHEIEQKEDGLDTQVDDVSSLIPIEDLYFSLEYDAELIPKLHLFDREREEVKEDQNDVEETVQVVEETIDAPNGLKYLLQHVKKQSANVNMKFIKKILNEAIPSKSKWANDGRVGQEQLYEALEKVLVALKNYTEHSLPFLKPVQKRDAPNYYLLIKNPMDLSTVFFTYLDV
jgi:hypothetical protein